MLYFLKYKKKNTLTPKSKITFQYNFSNTNYEMGNVRTIFLLITQGPYFICRLNEFHILYVF